MQITPPGSPASIQFGVGLTTMTPGSMEDMYLIVDDVEAARDDLIGHGADVSEIWHGRGVGTSGHEPGPDPQRSRTAASPRSPIRTATAGCCRRSRSASRAGWG